MEPQLLAALHKNKDNYWRTMGQRTQLLNQWLIEYGQLHPEFWPVIGRYTKKKAHLNGIQFYAGYLSGGGDRKSWERFIPTMISLELIMIWAYALNQIVDHKRAVWESPGGVEQTALEQNLLLGLLLELLGESREQLGDEYPMVCTLTHQMLANMSRGFWVEHQHLKIGRQPTEQLMTGWGESYRQRNRLIDQVYDYVPLIGYSVATGDQTIFNRFEQYFERRLRFSEAAQILNDFSDFLVGSNDLNVKSYQDAFADLRNGIVTFPVYRLWESAETQEAVGNPSVTLEQGWQERMRVVLKGSGLLKEIRASCWEAWDDQVGFWREVLGRDDVLLLGTYSLLGFNKYFKQAEN